MQQSLEKLSTIGDAANAVLNTISAAKKADIGLEVYDMWAANRLSFDFPIPPPPNPARPEKPELVWPTKVPRRGISQDQNARSSTLHALLHIELNAIDLAFDIISRFGKTMPKQFTDDWLCVGRDEAKHFKLISDRLAKWGVSYGDFAAHNNLWQAAVDTQENLGARLAIVPMVLEARGLDVTPKMIEQFISAADKESAEVLQTIYQEEISHVGFGVKWFEYFCRENDKKPNEYFHLLVSQFFKGKIKPPFNDEARQLAAMCQSYYKPIKQPKGLA
jgi:uncharacterized ferritin-like protein (DUF455 family)